MPKLIIITEGESPREVELSTLNTIGRHPSQSIQLLDRLVSKAHATITLKDGVYHVQDMGSRNGTVVNDEAVSGERPFGAGDVLKMGKTQCRVEVEAGERTRIHKVNIASGEGIQSSLQTMLRQEDARQFLPESDISDVTKLRAGYEHLRQAHVLREELANELDLTTIQEKILGYIFENLQVDRGAFLLYDKKQVLQHHLSRRRPGLDLDGQENEISISQTILSRVVEEKSAVISHDASLDSRFSGAQSIILQGIRSTMCVPLLSREKEVLGVMHLDNLLATGAFTGRDLSVVQGLADQAAMAIENTMLVDEIKSEAVTRQSFERLLSPNLVEKVVNGDLAVNRGGELREVTVLFSDIRGFTEMSENQPAPSIVEFLNEYFESMVEVVFDNDGTLDKFMGDGLMALWGAPVQGSDDAYKAVRAALQMQEELVHLNAEWERQGRQRVEIGIGVDTGQIVAGYLGSTRTMSYTVVGSGVNRAARLCGVAAPGQVLVSDTTLSKVEGRVSFERLPPVDLKGIKAPVACSNILGVRAATRTEGDEERVDGRSFTRVPTSGSPN